MTVENTLNENPHHMVIITAKSKCQLASDTWNFTGSKASDLMLTDSHGMWEHSDETGLTKRQDGL